ncbi:hypothetical protein PHK61_17070 [Actinomycetospora lutea]|uniref:hypothetical protein n=1 Tax=Actinomycetospora lutea TaxID=663604 RepID=UPI00236516E8|nr:hypothetical protein [Actinomycetospora lutea]MDD7940136.1 hypothetical protein [Actinomycetospora lutea]
MIRRHGRSRRRADRAVSGRLLGSRPGRVALLVLALGLVLMHHVVGAHQHAGPDVALDGATPLTAIAADRVVPPAAHHGTAHAEAHADGAREHAASQALPGTSDAGAALLHRHTDGTGHDHAGSLLHLCLVALLGAAALLLLLVLVALWPRPPSPRTGPAGVAPATATRAPPASSRLAELQVLRL